MENSIQGRIFNEKRTRILGIICFFKIYLHPYRMHLDFEGLTHALQNSPPDCFVPSLRSGRPFESHPGIKNSRYPDGYLEFLVRLFLWDSIKWSALSTVFSIQEIHIPSTSVPDASGRLWILPRPKKHATGMFFAPPSVGPSFRIPTL